MVRTQAKFIKPTRFGDNVTVDSTITFGRASFDVAHKLNLKGALCVEASETRVWVVRDPATGAIVRCQVEIMRFFNRGYYAGRWSHSGPVNLLERAP